MLIERPAGGGDVRVGCAAAQGDGGEQGGVEPAAVLVAAFEVEVGRAQLKLRRLDARATACPTGAGVEPDVEDVGLFAELCAAAVARTCAFGGQELGDGVVCQASAPSRSKRSTILRLSARIDDAARCSLSHMKTAMGTPQMRWRLMHQSGRVAIMLVMRSLPQDGIPDDLVDFFDGELAEGGFGVRRRASSGSQGR